MPHSELISVSLSVTFHELDFKENMDITVTKAGIDDVEKILQLQYAAYQSEARIHNDFTIQPLTQTLEESITEYHKCVVLKAVSGGAIVGSVRAHVVGNTVYIGKLMVLPDQQGKGLGKRLLTAIEAEFPQKRYELFTACKSSRNIHLYESSGYTRFHEETNGAGIAFAYMEKDGCIY